MTTEDRFEIQSLLARDLHMTDGRGSIEDCLDLWTEDCLWTSPVAGTFHGHAGVVERHDKYRGMGIQGPGVDAYHILTTVDVQVDDDAATAMSTWLLIVDARSAPTVQDIGTFEDTLHKVGGRWRIASRIVAQGTGEWLDRQRSETPNPEG